jgi:hypothetical protein
LFRAFKSKCVVQPEASPLIALFRGLRCGIEGKVADANQAKSVVLGDARERINQGIAHLAIAVVYPTQLRSIAFDRLQSELNSAQKAPSQF